MTSTTYSIRIESTGTVRESSSTSRATTTAVEIDSRGVQVIIGGKATWLGMASPADEAAARVLADRILAIYAEKR